MRSNMVRPLGLSSGVRTQNGPFGWICIIWFISTLDITAGQNIKLQTEPQVVAKCGDNVTLTCDVTGLKMQDLKEFYWMKKENNICEFEELRSANNTQFLCQSFIDDSKHNINLTIMKITPANEGTYHCKIRTKIGAANGKTIVRLEECIEDSQWSVSESDAECTFSGVYPSGVVSWSLGGTNLTDVKTVQTKEADGRFTIKSKVKKRKGNTTQLYICSLRLPFNSTEQMHVVRKHEFAGSGEVKLQWICMLVEVVLLISAVQF